MNLAHLLERQALRAPEQPALLSGSQGVARHGEWADRAGALAPCLTPPNRGTSSASPRSVMAGDLPQNAFCKALKTALREQWRTP